MSDYRKHFSEEGARRYALHRKRGKHDAEMRLIHRAMMLVPSTHQVLDVPCGGGRVMLDLAQRGYTVTGADVSEGMLKMARQAVAASGLNCDGSVSPAG